MLLHDKLLNSREIVLKKKNSLIESRLFGKTRYYVIAVGNRPVTKEEDSARVRAYIYYNGYICFYNTQGKAYNKQEYVKYIDFVKQAIQANRYSWTDFWINKGQIITRDKRNNILVDNELVPPFRSRSRVAGEISEMSLNLYCDFLKNSKLEDEDKLKLLQLSNAKKILKTKIERAVRRLPSKQLIDTDGEIIVRTKIEGYNYIMSYVKLVLESEDKNKYRTINDFFMRVFFLEMYGYICDEQYE